MTEYCAIFRRETRGEERVLLINNELPKCNENTSEEGGFLVYSNDTLNKILSKSSSKLHPLGGPEGGTPVILCSVKDDVLLEIIGTMKKIARLVSPEDVLNGNIEASIETRTSVAYYLYNS